MKGLLSGGPAEGVVDTRGLETFDGRCWTINIVHVNCACAWCQDIAARSVTHQYERDDEGLFRYRRSFETPPEPGP